ncbi:EAL domain-containing protein [Klebsiella pneumoniae]
MKNDNQHIIILNPELENIEIIPIVTNQLNIIVFLPDDPMWILYILRKVGWILRNSKKNCEMLIMSNSPHNWLWQTLLHLTGDKSLLRGVRIIDSTLSIKKLESILKNDWKLYQNIENTSELNSIAYGNEKYGLTKAELNAVLDYLTGTSLHRQAKARGLSPKTLYNQRVSGVRKMMKSHPNFRSTIRLVDSENKPTVDFTQLSPIEKEFISSIYTNSVYPVFQPISDDDLKIKGFEILIRWDNLGKTKKPHEFLPEIKSRYTWMLLTAYILQTAIKCINSCNEDIYFSINIPSKIAGDNGILRMLEVALKQLKNPHNVKRILLEYSENTDFYSSKNVSDTINSIKTKGVKVLLDDCFSERSGPFPLRTIQFDGYKLDISIVNEVIENRNSYALIKTISHYCSLVGSMCIAEGVESVHVFNKLKEVGIKNFQGYFISKPVRMSELQFLVKSSKDHYHAIDEY